MPAPTSEGPPSRASGVHYAWVVLGLIVLSVFGSLGLARFGYTSILPSMQAGLGLTNTQTGELQSWNLLGYLLTVVPAGVLAARFGPRFVIAAALLVTGLAMILTGWAPTLAGARWGRFLAGVGGAGANVPAMGLVSAWFGARRRGMATGIGVAGSSIGLMLTGPLVPAILGWQGEQGWRVCWYVLGSLALAIAAAAGLGLRNRPADQGLTPWGESDLERSQGGPRASALNWSLVYRSGALWHLSAIYFAFGFSYIIYSTFFIRHLVHDGGLTAEQAGWLWLMVGLVSTVSGFIWGGVSDRWGRRTALIAVFSLQGLGFLVFGLSLKTAAIALSAGLFALTAWSIPALMAALAGDIFGGRLAPAALGLMTVVFGIGQVLGPYVAGWIADGTRSFTPAFLLGGVAAWLLGVGGSFLLHPNIQRR
ncbi:MAG TPA: YbfB/YjiJ family MFS transporter [Candidatus Paceibacterota bacterium]|nr:YbfB/YjiJ family MFS transporter [Verrucomicrobiota bacterium]HRZ44152.1 YbfB/YjiJ family MFS transporter [Candidatus Paceibacterota bacterium]